MNKRSDSFFLHTALFFVGIVFSTVLVRANQPNVVFILTDDQRGMLSAVWGTAPEDSTDRPVGGGGSVVPQPFLHHFAVLAQPGIHPRRALCPCPWGGQ